MAMSWRPAPAALVERFAELLPDDPRVERRKMFGYPCAFLGGNLFTGLFQERMMLRLPEAARSEFLRLPGAAIFEPMPGRPMREYVVVPQDLIADAARIGPWLARALAFAASLPVRLPKGKPAARGARPKGRGTASPSGKAAAGKSPVRKVAVRKAGVRMAGARKAAKPPKRRMTRNRARG